MSRPSPYCGRMDQHEPHPWTSPGTGMTHHCPGPPRASVAEQPWRAEPTKQREGDQVLPSGAGACVQDRVIADMEESKRVGLERYGSVLKTFNGRRSIQDVHEEVRDLFVYLTQIRMEAEATREELIEVVKDALIQHQEDRYGVVIPELDIEDAATVAVDRILGHVVGKEMQA